MSTIYSKLAIAQMAQDAAREKGAAATNPFPPLDAAYLEWETCFERALCSDVLEGAEA